MRKKRTHKYEIKQNTTALMDFVTVDTAWLIITELQIQNILRKRL